MRAGRRMSGPWTVAGIAIVAALLFLPSAAQAVPEACAYSAGLPGEWDDAPRWSCGHVPDADDLVTLDSGDDVTVNVAAVTGTLTLTSGTLRFTGGNVLDVGGATTLGSGEITGSGRLDANGALTKNGSGQVAVSGGAVVDALAGGDWDGGPLCLQTNGILRVHGTFDVAAGGFGFNCQDASATFDVEPAATVSVAGSAADVRAWNAPMDLDGLLDLDGSEIVLNLAGANTHAGDAVIAAGATLALQTNHAFGATSRVGGPGTLRVASGSSSIADGATLDPATLTLQAGSLSLDGTGPATTLPVVNAAGGSFGGARDRAITTLNAQSGTFTGDHTATVATLAKTSAGQFQVTSDALLDVTGDSTWSDGPLCVNVGGDLRIRDSLAVSAGGFGFNCQDASSAVTIDPAATVTVAGSAANSRAWNSPMDIDGTLQLDGSEIVLNLAGANTHAGDVNLGAAGTLTLQTAQTFAATSRVGGAGTLRTTSGTSTLPNGAVLDPATLTLQGGTLTLDGTSPATTLPLVNAIGGIFAGVRDRSITTLNAQSGAFTGNHTATVATLNKTTAGQFQVTGDALLDATGDGTWSDGPLCVNVGGDLRIRDSLAVSAGGFGFNCQDASSAVTIDPAATVTVAGSAANARAWNSPMDIDGTLQLDGSEIVLNLAGANTHAGDVNLGAAGTLTLQTPQAFGATSRVGGAGTLRVTSGESTLPGGAVLDPSTLTLQGGTLTLDGTSPATTLPLVNAIGGSFAGVRDRSITTLNAQSGAFTGNHTATVATLNKTTAGQFAVTGDALLAATGDVTWAEGPICLQTEGVLRVDDELDVAPGTHGFNCQDGTARLDLQPGSVVDLGDGTRAWNAPVTNGTTFTLGAGDNLAFNSGFTNEPGATLTGTGTGSGTVTNAGGLVSPASGTLTLAVLNQTSGQTTVAAGETLALLSTHGLSGGTTDVDGTMSATQHTISSGGALTVDGGLTGPVIVDGGSLAGTGELEDNLTNGGGTVRPGTSPGRLTIDGSYTQGAGGTLAVEVAGNTVATQFDQLAVTGHASLSGTLAITRPGGFTPAVGSTFQVLTSSSRSGAFSTVTGTAIGADREFEARYPDGPAFGALLAVLGPDAPGAGTPQVTGSVAVGSTVTCLEGTWTGDPAFTYQWLRDGAAIGGATARTYAIVAADAGRQLSCRVTGTNGTGSDEATSAARNVPAVAPQSTAPPTIGGTGTLTCAPGTFTGAPAPTPAFQWLRDGVPIPGATGTSYTLTDADAGHAVACRVTATNAGGSASGTSAPVDVPARPTPTPTATPSPTPTPTPTPTPKPKPPLQNATPQQVAAAFGLPPARACVSRRNFIIRLREPKGIRIRSARVLVNGKRTKVRKAKGRFVARVDLRGLPKGRFTVSIRIKTRDKRTLKGARRYRTCAKKPSSKRNTRPGGGAG